MLKILSPPYPPPFYFYRCVNNLCIILAVPEYLKKIRRVDSRPLFLYNKDRKHRKSDGKNRFYDAFHFYMKRPKKKNNLESVQKIAMEWIWVILFISAVLFLRGLLSDMNTQTNRLAEEREKFQEGLTEEREKSKKLYQEFYAEINDSIRKTVESLNKGEYIK